MYKILLAAAFSLASLICPAQLQLTQIGQLPYTEDLSDIWGYQDTSGVEYALVGVFDGFSIVSLDTPSAPREVAFVPGSSTIWRDVKVWDHYAYVTSEGNDALLIVDLQYLPDSIKTWTRSPLGMSSAHNIFIDEQGRGFVVGADVNVGGAIILDLVANPINPPVLAHYTNFYIHDIFVRGDTMWSAHINNGFVTIVDISNLANINSPGAEMGRQTTPNNFAHNVWLSDDNNYMFTTDERSDAYVAAYDVRNTFNISERDRVQSSPGNLVIPHNTFYINDHVVTSYYRDGVTIHDVEVPENMVETENFDTAPLFAGNGFNGCWGVYPYAPSGLIYATDIEEGLYIFGATYRKAARITGIVRDSLCGSVLNNVNVEVLLGSAQEQTDITGRYYAGQVDTGLFDVQFSLAGYQTKIIPNVQFTAGVMDTLNVELVALNTIDVSILVLDSATGNPIPNADLLFAQGNFDVLQVSTDANGLYQSCAFPADIYDIYYGKWSYLTRLMPNQNMSGGSFTDTLLLGFGYYDDFIFDFDWIDSSNAATGDWDLGEPNGTLFQGIPSNPGDDVAGDFGRNAYVTGNSGVQAGDDDIDDGQVFLISPQMDLTLYNDPVIDFSLWFFNDGGSGSPNDFAEVAIWDGNTRVVLTNQASTQTPWTDYSFRVKQFVTPSANMYLEVTAVDQSPGHLSEAGFDYFRVSEWVHPSCVENLVVNPDTMYTSTGPSAHTLNVVANDIIEDIDSIEIQIVDQPSIGDLTLMAGGEVQFVSNEASNTFTSFSYAVCNPCPTCDTTTVFISIAGTGGCISNRYPFFANAGQNPIDEYRVESNRNTVDDFCIDDIDPDRDSTFRTILQAPSNGQLIPVGDSCYRYQPNLNFVGQDTAFIEVCDRGLPSLCDTIMIVIRKNESVGIGSFDVPSAYVFPNPGSSSFNIQFEASFAGDVELIDMMGRTVGKWKVDDQSQWKSPDLSNLSTGTYVIRMNNDVQVEQIHWLKE